MRSMHTITSAVVAALLGLALAFSNANAETLPRQIILEMEIESNWSNLGRAIFLSGG